MALPLLKPVARILVAASLALAAAPALAQSDDFDLDDILGTTPEKPPSDTIRSEREDVLRGDLNDRPGDESTGLETPDERRGRLRPIKVLQPKNFLKIGRWEAAPHIGFVTSDPFLNRYLIGAGLTYHVTEILGVELSGTFSPDLGEGDYKAITKQLINENQVSPDISRVMWFLELGLVFSPIYGKVAIGGKSIGNYDIYGVFGTGVTQTREDLDALQSPDDPITLATATQIHPTSNIGGGIRMVFGPSIAVKVDARSMIYVETVNSTVLELKNVFMLKGAVSFYFPGMK